LWFPHWTPAAKTYLANSPEQDKNEAHPMLAGVRSQEERVRKALRVAAIAAAGLFLWTAAPLAAKPAAAIPAAAQPAAKPKKNKKSKKPKNTRKTTHPRNRKTKPR
jgi:hypothetical protein